MSLATAVQDVQARNDAQVHEDVLPDLLQVDAGAEVDKGRGGVLAKWQDIQP